MRTIYYYFLNFSKDFFNFPYDLRGGEPRLGAASVMEYMMPWNLVVVQSLSHAQLCGPMDYSTLVSPVLHCLPEFSQTHVH